MTEFSSQWLALREPADHRARDQALQATLVHYLENIASTRMGAIRLIDLGSGTGSNLRALAPFLPQDQHWTLVDNDPALLQKARSVLMDWADESLEKNADQGKASINAVEPLTIVKQDQHITVEFRCDDLAKNIESVLALPADVITAAAFFDLVAEQWLHRFCNTLLKPLYTVLTYNGLESWSPPEASDAQVLKAFHHHQQTDKGFGAAAGPHAIAIMESLLQQRGFKTHTASSPWLLTEQDRSLIESLASGSAAAALETKLVSQSTVNQWGISRALATECQIGHTDFLAMPEVS
jgi:SAM-dependent methyltransferase